MSYQMIGVPKREREREIIERWQVEKSGENKIYNRGKRKNTNKR